MNIEAILPNKAVEGEVFEVTYRVRNIDTQLFPGGVIHVTMSWPNIGNALLVGHPIQIKKLNPGDYAEQSRSEKPATTGMTIFSLLADTFKAIDGGKIELHLKDGRKLRTGQLIAGVRARGREEINQARALWIAVVSLIAILAFQIIDWLTDPRMCAYDGFTHTPGLILDSSVAQEIVYLVFGVTLAVYFVSLLEKWPRISRFSIVAKDRKSQKIMAISWLSLLTFLFLSLKAIGQYFSYIRFGITDDFSLVFYIISLLSLLLLPKSLSGFIRGVNIVFLPDYFHEMVKEACKQNNTIEALYLSREHIKDHKLLDRNNVSRYGIMKVFGNSLLLATFLLVLWIGPNWFLILPLILLVIALALPKIEEYFRGS